MGARERLLEHPTIYRVWQAPFAAIKFAPVERRLRDLEFRSILDVGCGTGTNAWRFEGFDYVGLDINQRYLDTARARCKGRFVQADLRTADLSALGTFDAILVNSFLHHVPDADVERILTQLSQMLSEGGRVHMLELVLPERKSLAGMMARLDRGRFARPLEQWREMFASAFNPTVEEAYMYGGGLWSMVYLQGQRRR